MDGYGRGPGGGRGRGEDGREEVRYLPDAAPQSGMYPGPWGEGRFTFRRADGSWYDEGFTGHTFAEGEVLDRGRYGALHHGSPGPAPERASPRGWRGRPGEGRARAGGDSDRIRAWQIMTEDPTTVTPDTPLTVAAQLMRELDVGVIPVVDDDAEGRLVGVITDRDMVVRCLADGKDGRTAVGDCMTSEVSAVAPGDSVHDVLDVMKHERVRRVPVTDDEGRLVGIISQADLAVSYAGLDVAREAEVEEAIERISEPRHANLRGPRAAFRQSRRY